MTRLFHDVWLETESDLPPNFVDLGTTRLSALRDTEQETSFSLCYRNRQFAPDPLTALEHKHTTVKQNNLRHMQPVMYVTLKRRTVKSLKDLAPSISLPQITSNKGRLLFYQPIYITFVLVCIHLDLLFECQN